MITNAIDIDYRDDELEEIKPCCCYTCTRCNNCLNSWRHHKDYGFHILMIMIVFFGIGIAAIFFNGIDGAIEVASVSLSISLLLILYLVTLMCRDKSHSAYVKI